MRFLVDRGIELTIREYRWDATAQGWARVASQDEKMAHWLQEAERQREQGRWARQSTPRKSSIFFGEDRCRMRPINRR